MLPRTRSLSLCYMLLFISFLVTGCGGGGGATSSGTGSILYTGLHIPAQITASNAEVLATNALESGALSNPGGVKSQSTPSTISKSLGGSAFGLSKTLKGSIAAINGISRKPSSAKAADGSIPGDASCVEGPGNFEFILSYHNDNTVKGVFIYNGYCSRGTRLTGTTNVDFQFDSATLQLLQLSISFDTLTVQSGTVSYKASGTINYYNIQDTSYNEAIDLLVMDSASLKVFKTEGLETVNSVSLNYIDVTVTGGIFYHPDYGYVSMSTAAPMRYYDNAATPFSGAFQVDGGANTKALLSFYFPDSYRVQADTNGDGLLDTDSGVKVWAGRVSAYLPPAADAGADQTVYEDQKVTLDGSASISRYGTPLTYSWSIISAPEASTSALTGQNTVSPNFTPDMAGTYVLSLIVNDGNSDSPADTVTVTVNYIPIFSAYQSTRTGSWAEAVAIGDLNGDGRADVALVTDYYNDPQNDQRLYVFLQNATGGLEQAVKYQVLNGRPSSVVVGDVSHDGRDDVVVGTDAGITIFLQNSSGSLSAPVFYQTGHAHHLALGDFNNDGRLDVAGIGPGEYTVEVRLQTGAGTLSAPATYMVAYFAHNMIDAGDINGDGLTDIVVSYGSSFGIGLVALPQNSMGTFGSPAYFHISDTTADFPRGLAAGDVNGDNRDDMVVAYGGNPLNKIGVYLQNAQGGMGQQISYPAFYTPQPVVITDVNRDGRKDVLVAHGGWHTLSVFLQGRNGKLGGYQKYPIPYATNYNPQGLAVGDINSDGKKDVVIADYNNGLVVLYNIY